MVLVKVPQPAERFLFLFCFVLFLSLLPSPSPSPNTCYDPHPRTYVRTFVQEMARAEAVMEQKGDVESTSSGTPTHDASTEDGTQPHHDDDVVTEQHKDHDHEANLKRMGLLTALALGLHNFPEGLATFIATLVDPRAGYES